MSSNESLPPDLMVSVRRHPQDWKTAIYRMSDVADLHWDTVSGGVQRSTAYPALFGYVLCDRAVSGEVAHSCAHGPAPHRIKICLPQVCNRASWKAILASAPAKPKRRSDSDRASVEALARAQLKVYGIDPDAPDAIEQFRVRMKKGK